VQENHLLWVSFQAGEDIRHGSNMANQNNDLENTEKSETGSQKIIISKSPKSCDSIAKRHEDLETSNSSPPILRIRHLESRDRLPFGLPSTMPDAPTVDESKQEQRYRERFPPRINSTPNFTSNIRTTSGTFKPGLRLVLLSSPHSRLKK